MINHVPPQISEEPSYCSFAPLASGYYHQDALLLPFLEETVIYLLLNS